MPQPLKTRPFFALSLLLFSLESLTSCSLFQPATKPARSVATRKPAPRKPALARTPANPPANGPKRSLTPRHHSAPPGSTVSNLIATARSYLESPYTTGGNTSGGLDCSGFVSVCFRQIGLSMPRVARQQAEVGSPVAAEALLPGDLVFFTTNGGPGSTITHTGIVTEVRGAEGVWFIHSSSSQGVREDNLLSPYWQRAYAWGRRVEGL